MTDIVQDPAAGVPAADAFARTLAFLRTNLEAS